MCVWCLICVTVVQAKSKDERATSCKRTNERTMMANSERSECGALLCGSTLQSACIGFRMWTRWWCCWHCAIVHPKKNMKWNRAATERNARVACTKWPRFSLRKTHKNLQFGWWVETGFRVFTHMNPKRHVILDWRGGWVHRHADFARAHPKNAN